MKAVNFPLCGDLSLLPALISGGLILGFRNVTYDVPMSTANAGADASSAKNAL